MNPRLESNRISIRPIQPEDTKEVFAYRSDRETNQYQGFVPQHLDEVDAFIAKNPKEFNQAESWFQLVIIENTSNTVIGDIGVHFIGDDGHQCELGCTLGKQYHGKGFATEAMQMVINYLFKQLHKHRIIGSVDPRNLASIQLLERLGFRKEAHFIQSLLINEEWVDDVMYGLLKAEWKE